MKPIIESLAFYPIEISAESAEDGGGYSACIPALGRLAFEASGATIDGAIANLKRVSEILLEEFRERGLDLPDPPPRPDDFSGRLLLRMPKHIHRRLDREARENGVSLNSYIVSILADSAQSPQLVNSLKEICNHISSARRSLNVPSSQYENAWTVVYQKEAVAV